MGDNSIILLKVILPLRPLAALGATYLMILFLAMEADESQNVSGTIYIPATILGT